jgi:hypothetical protein
MYQGGTRDFGVTPALQKSTAYDQSPEPNYFVKVDNAGHFARTDIGITAHEESLPKVSSS